MNAVVKFPLSKDYGGINSFYAEALKEHSAYIESEKRRMRRLFDKSEAPPAWMDVDEGSNEVICITMAKAPKPDEYKAALNNLVGFATDKGKTIQRAWRGMRDGKWSLVAEIA
jgi:hypothetical protein